MDVKEIADGVIAGKLPVVKELVQAAIDQGVPAEQILQDGLLAGMAVIGDRFKRNEIYVPNVLLAARAMKAGTEMIKPLLVQAGVKPLATVVIGTVKGDLHDIGKNLVGMMMEGAGLKVVDAGIDVSAEKFVALARENQAKVVGVSALLTTTMLNMKGVVDAAHAEGFKVMIGGAPVTQSFADEIGADGYSPDAASAAELAKTLVA